VIFCINGAYGSKPGALSVKGPGAQGEAVAVDTPRAALYHRRVGQFLEILVKPDNIPIVGMLFLVLFFTWVGLKQALRNDRLIEQGRQDEILKEMQR
jgi:hypothetical protein